MGTHPYEHAPPKDWIGLILVKFHEVTAGVLLSIGMLPSTEKIIYGTMMYGDIDWVVLHDSDDQKDLVDANELTFYHHQPWDTSCACLSEVPNYRSIDSINNLVLPF